MSAPSSDGEFCEDIPKEPSVDVPRGKDCCVDLDGGGDEKKGALLDEDDGGEEKPSGEQWCGQHLALAEKLAFVVEGFFVDGGLGDDMFVWFGWASESDPSRLFSKRLQYIRRSCQYVPVLLLNVSY